MKIGIVYTSTTPELIECIEKEIISNIGNDVSFLSFQDPSILEDAKKNGYVTAKAASKLINLYSQAISEGADIILNACSSVGEVADSIQSFSRYCGIPIVRIDEEMCRQGILSGKKIGVMATLSTTLNPTKNTILRLAREVNRNDIEIVDCLVEGAFGINQEEFKSKMSEYALKIADKVDVVIFAQGSMAYCESHIEKLIKKPVFSSPRFGARALKEALIKKGLL